METEEGRVRPIVDVILLAVVLSGFTLTRQSGAFRQRKWVVICVSYALQVFLLAVNGVNADAHGVFARSKGDACPEGCKIPLAAIQGWGEGFDLFFEFDNPVANSDLVSFAGVETRQDFSLYF